MYYSVLTPDAQKGMLQPVCQRLLPLLKNMDDAQTMCYGLDLAGCLVSSFKLDTPIPLCTELMQTALAVLMNQSVDMDLKPRALTLFYELSNCPKDFVISALPAMLPLVCGACSLVCDVRGVVCCAVFVRPGARGGCKLTLPLPFPRAHNRSRQHA